MGEVTRTPLGSLLCCVNEGKEGAPHLLLEAHLDQIGFIVTRVEEGFLRFSKVGGIDARWLPATPVVIHAEKGDYPGIVTSVPPHLAGDGADHSIKIENLLIDTGFTAETAAKLFAPGDIVTFGSRHVGIISDKRNRDGIPYLIHNGGQPRREEDALLRCHRNHPISGHFRWNGGTETN